MRCPRLIAILMVTTGCRGGTEARPDPAAPTGSAARTITGDAPLTVSIDVAPPRVAAPHTRTITFDTDVIDKPPAGFVSLRTGPGPLGSWRIQHASDAPSPPHAVVQRDPDPTDARFPMLVAETPSFRDGRVAVRCKAMSGQVDQACGLVIRLVDENNYYVTRSNVLEDNIRLYHVVKGKRTEIASYSGGVARGWHELAIEARGDQFRVSWDGKQVIEHRDSTIDKAGRGGLWTKADSVTQFDDLVIESLDPPSTP